MIATVQRHWQAESLLRHLYQPEQRDPHGLPHLVSGSQEPASLEPERISTGSRNIGRLVGWLHAVLPPSGQHAEQPIWHCTVRAHPQDRPLSDAQWAQVATDIMDRTQLAPRRDPRAVRWIAVRHGRDHLHLVASLARQDRAPAEAAGAAARAQAACHEAEDRLGLRSTRKPGPGPSSRPAGPVQLARTSFPASARAVPVPGSTPTLVPARQPAPRLPRPTSPRRGR
jgi:hypothetical protein